MSYYTHAHLLSSVYSALKSDISCNPNHSRPSLSGFSHLTISSFTPPCASHFKISLVPPRCSLFPDCTCVKRFLPPELTPGNRSPLPCPRVFSVSRVAAHEPTRPCFYCPLTWNFRNASSTRGWLVTSTIHSSTPSLLGAICDRRRIKAASLPPVGRPQHAYSVPNWRTISYSYHPPPTTHDTAFPGLPLHLLPSRVGVYPQRPPLSPTEFLRLLPSSGPGPANLLHLHAWLDDLSGKLADRSQNLSRPPSTPFISACPSLPPQLRSILCGLAVTDPL